MSDAKDGPSSILSEVDFTALPAGEFVGRYEVLSVLGQGSFGITYRARDTQLGREVALKEYLPTALAARHAGMTVLPRSTKVAEDFAWGRSRFLDEARTLAMLENVPAVVRVLDFLEANGTAYMLMALAQGETLEHRLQEKGPLTAAEVDGILWPLLDGLEQVHSAGFLHRDIKPANILLSASGRPTLIDFGAARAAMAGRTVAMTAIFTPGYAAAEQFTSAKQGPWTDIYGLSATLYHAITGKVPPSAFDRMLDDAYEPLGQLRPKGFLPGLLIGVDAGLAVRSVERPQSIGGWRPILTQTSVESDVTLVSKPVALPTAPPSPVTVAAPSTSPVESPAVVAAALAPARSRAPLYVGIAVAVLALAGGGSYFALIPGNKPVPTATTVQDLKIEDLERVLAERRKADVAAAEKKRLEEEAQRKAEADTAAKRAADVELADAQMRRQKAEEDLAKLKADMEARRLVEAGQREQADVASRRAAAEAAQRKAEAEMAALKQAEEDARGRAATEADAKRQADEALAKAQTERQKAEAEAKQKAEAEAKQKAESSTKEVAEAEARQRAEASAKQKADAEAKQKADAEAAAAAEKKGAEAAEMALRLTTPDRQRLQVALTSLGFDTRGTDGAFGPRSREMISAWQNARNQPVTGFLMIAQQQALLREAAPAITKYDDEQKKIEDEKKKAEEDKKKADEEAKAKAAAAAAPVPGSPATTAPAAPSGTGPFDGSYGGAISVGGVGGVAGVRPSTIRIVNGVGTGTFANPRCGSSSISLRISPAGEVSGEAAGFDSYCGKVPLSARGRVASGQLQLNLSGPGGTGGSGTLTLGAAAPAAVAPSASPPAAAAVTAATPGAGSADATYGGSINMGSSNNAFIVPILIQVSNGTGAGAIRSTNCGQGPISIRISPAGDVSGEATGFDRSCGKVALGIRGRLVGNQLQLNFSGPGSAGSATLTRQ